ncbi:WxL domain-containing protein [Enterococcus sp. LJL120]
MKNKKKLLSVLTASLLFSLIGTAPSVQAASHSLNGQGSVSVTDSGVTPPVDPEFPDKEVDPGETPSTTGPLRIDFVSQLRFGLNKITDTNREYLSLAQLFHDDTNARGYYVQITDRREDTNGWELQVSQENQFHNDIIQDVNEQELAGAMLSFDKGWANSVGTSGTPQVTSDTILMNDINNAYTVAVAGDNQGVGTWTIEFGASGDNEDNLENTLAALVDSEGNAVVNETFNKAEYSNSAIKLTIPNSTKIHPVKYTTSLTWMLIAGPTD